MQIAPLERALYVGALIPCILLWDWSWPYLFLAGIVSLFPVAIILGSLLTPAAPHHDTLQANSFSKQPKRLPESTVTVLVTVSWALAILAIVAHREMWTSIFDLLHGLAGLSTPAFPTLGKIQPQMIVEGFAERIAVTETVAAISLIFAAASSIPAAAIGWRKFEQLTLLSSHERMGGTALPPVALLVTASLVMVSLAVYISIEPGISASHSKREAFAEFETSDLSLFGRMWLVPTCFFFLAGFTIGLLGRALFERLE